MEDDMHPRIFIFSIIIGAILLFFVFGAFFQAKNRTGTIVLPGGRTYLGPTPTKQMEKSNGTLDEKIPIPANTKWAEKKGAVFPYSFLYPKPLSLGVFPNDPYDAVTIFYDGTDSNANIFFRIENLTTLKKSHYAGNIEEYANTWWKDYAWKGVSSVTPFTNAHGLKGYRASYTNDLGKTPYDHVFFEVPGNQHLVIWISEKLFSPDIFDKIINSVSWTNTSK